MNIVALTLSLGRDPVVRESEKGKSASTGAAWNSRPDKNGVKETTWFDLTCYGDYMSDQLLKYKKGAFVTVTCKFEGAKKWTGRDGKENTSLKLRVDAIEPGPDYRSKSSGPAGQADVTEGDIPY